MQNKPWLLRLLILVPGLILFSYFYDSYQGALWHGVDPESSLYFLLTVITSLIIGFLFELAPFKQSISFKKREVLILAGIFIFLVLLTLPSWFIVGRLVGFGIGYSIIIVMPLLGAFMGIYLAKVIS